MMANQPFTVRASSWGSLFDCAHAWEGVHIMKLRKPSGLRAQLGTAIHAGTAAFDIGRLPGNTPITPDDAAGVFVDALRSPDAEVDLGVDDLTVKEAESIGLKLTTSYCFDIAPQFTFVDVEAKLKPLEIVCGNGILVRLTGSMDRARVAMCGSGHVITDVKTGARAIEDGQVKTTPHLPQLGTYQVMYEQDRQINTAGSQILGMKTSGKPVIDISPVVDAKSVMVGDEDSPGLIQYAAAMFRTGLFPPNTKSILCSDRYCARWQICRFRGR
ncbi:MAG: PD-(D/E)XK nuclease family protein [Aquabacterium sp.]|uniref:PD-(D/E)XK nuclease family protein n=1 Tax=Aquabacterium sp. TaxID=1872578 RepID=UPI003BB00038